MAADKQGTVGAHTYTVTKIARIGPRLVGVSGTAVQIGEFFHWVKTGRKPSKFLKETEHLVALVVEPDGRVLRYETSPFPIVVEDPQHATGSGRDYAITAMHFGKTAAEAIQVAALFDENTGRGVDSLVMKFK